MNTILLMAMMAVAAGMGAVGQILLKQGSEKLQLTIMGLATNIYLWGFVALYGLAVIINLAAYKLGGKVSIVYPVISLSYIFSAILAWKYLGEPFNIYTLLGCVIIIAGVACIGYGASVTTPV